jgi:hypothetical protein
MEGSPSFMGTNPSLMLAETKRSLLPPHTAMTPRTATNIYQYVDSLNKGRIPFFLKNTLLQQQRDAKPDKIFNFPLFLIPVSYTPSICGI